MMGKMKELFMQQREEMLDNLSWDPTGSWTVCDKLMDLVKEGYWIQVSPLSKIKSTVWIAAIYIKGKTAWVTDVCKSGFEDPKQAYEWAEEEIIKINYNKVKPKKV